MKDLALEEFANRPSIVDIAKENILGYESDLQDPNLSFEEKQWIWGRIKILQIILNEGSSPQGGRIITAREQRQKSMHIQNIVSHDLYWEGD